MLELETIAEKGNELETLKALRQKLAQAIDNTKSGRDIASLSRQLQNVIAQITELEKPNQGNQGETGSDKQTTMLELVRQKHKTDREKIAKGE